MAHRIVPYTLSIRGVVDGAGAGAVPLALMLGAEPRTAWLLGVLWPLKLIPGIPGLRQLRRVLVGVAEEAFVNIAAHLWTIGFNGVEV